MRATFSLHRKPPAVLVKSWSIGIRYRRALAASHCQHEVSSARSSLKTLGEKKAASADRIAARN
jgi:hypothetical protein